MANELDIAARPSGDGMPIGNELTPMIQSSQVELGDGTKAAAFDDNAALTIAVANYMAAQEWLDTNSWLAEWQYVDYLYQSPNYDRNWRFESNRPVRISRFNVAKNRNTMSTQVRRGIFAEQNPFVLEPRGKLASNPDAQKYIDAWTELFSVLSDRADFEYNMTLLIEDQVLQGTGIANPGWDTRTVIKKSRKRKNPPAEVDMPIGGKKKVNTWQSDDFKVVEDAIEESWPYFEYRRLGTTMWDEKWRTPGRPDLTAGYKVDVDYLTLQDLQQLRKLDCYKDIPSDDDLKKFFLDNPYGDAETESQTAQAMNTQSTIVLHAAGENKNTSANPFEKPMLKVAVWDKERVIEYLSFQGRKKVIRNDEHEMGDHALGYSATWWNIPNSGYGLGQGRLNAGDQRMDQGVLNEVLKMIAFPMNAPILYDSSSGNAPTQNVVMGMGTFWGVDASKTGGDVSKAMRFFETPPVPAEAWKVYELGKTGGEDLVGANSGVMQGNLGGPGSSMGRTAAGVNRLGSKADENVSDPIAHLEWVIKRWLEFLWDMVLEVMPIAEIRAILSDKFGEAILDEIDAEEFLNVKFEIKILAGQKLQAKAAIMQLIPFLLQLVQQPQLMQFMHEKGWTVNFKAIEDLFMQMSELQGREDIIIPLTPEEKQQVAQMNPNAMKAQIAELLERLKGQNRIGEIQEKGRQDLQKSIVDKTLDHVEGSVPLELAEARETRNVDLGELNNGFETAAG